MSGPDPNVYIKNEKTKKTKKYLSHRTKMSFNVPLVSKPHDKSKMLTNDDKNDDKCCRKKRKKIISSNN